MIIHSSIMSSSNYDIYRIFDFNRLLEAFTLSKNLDEMYQIIDTLFILGYSKDASDKISEMKLKKPEVVDDIKWVKLCLKDAVEKKDDFLSKMIIKRIRDDFHIPEYQYKYILIEGVKGINEFYENSLLPYMNSHRFFKVSDLYLSIYFWNKITNVNHIQKKIFESKLAKKFKSISIKKDFSINDIVFAENYLKAIAFHKYVNNNIDISNESDNIDNMLSILFKSFSYYSDSKKKILSDIYIAVCDHLYVLSGSDKYQKLINDFIKIYSNHVSIYQNYLYNNTGSDVDFVTALKSICDNNETENIVNLFLYEMANNNWTEITDDSIVNKCSESDNCRKIVSIMSAYAKYICDEPLEPLKAKELFNTLNIPELVQSAINYENGNLSDLNLDKVIINLKPMYINDKLFYRIFRSLDLNNNILRLIEVLRLLNLEYSDSIVIYLQILQNIKDDKIIVNYFEFEQIIQPLITLENFDILHLIIIISYKFENYNEKCCEMINKNIFKLNQGLIQKIDYENYRIILFNYLAYIIKSSHDFDVTSICSSTEIEDLLMRFSRTNSPELLLLSGQVYPEHIKKNYIEILNYLDEKEILDINKWDDINKRVYIIAFIEITIFQRDNDYGEEDQIFYKDHFFYAKECTKLRKYYDRLGITTNDSFDDVSSYSKLSLINKYISSTVFKNYISFGLTSMNIPMNISSQEILREIGKHIHFDQKVKAMQNLEEGGDDSPLLSVYNELDLIKRIQQIFDDKQKTNLFNNINNDKIFNGEKKIIHPSSIILLAVINGLDVLDRNTDCFTIDSFYFDMVSQYSYPIIDLADGILSRKVYVEDTKERLAKTLVNLKENNRIIKLPEGGLFSRNDFDKFHRYDLDIFKTIVKDGKARFGIVTDDKFYYSNDLLKACSTGVFSLVVESFCKGLISDSRLYEITQCLNDINYRHMFTTNIMGVLLNKLDKANPSKDLENTIDILTYGKS